MGLGCRGFPVFWQMVQAPCWAVVYLRGATFPVVLMLIRRSGVPDRMSSAVEAWDTTLLRRIEVGAGVRTRGAGDWVNVLRCTGAGGAVRGLSYGSKESCCMVAANAADRRRAETPTTLRSTGGRGAELGASKTSVVFLCTDGADAARGVWKVAVVFLLTGAPGAAGRRSKETLGFL